MRLALLLLAANQVVWVPTGGDAEQCAVRTRLAAAAQLSPKVRVLRAPLKGGEGLAQGRRRLGAQWALDGRAHAATSTVHWLGKGHEAQAQSTDGDDLRAALKATWPKPLERAEASGLAGAANAEAVRAACAQDADTAYEAAGAAAAPNMATMVPAPRALKQGTLLQRWAWAKGQLQQPYGCKKAQPTLRSVTYELEHGHLPPIWRRPPRDSRRPTAITRVDGAWVLYEDGRFFAVDPDSGQPLWQREVAEAEPAPVRLADGLLALLTTKGVTVIETKTGTTAWRAALRNASAELVTTRGLLIISGRERVHALDLRTGQPRWSYDGLSRPAAGPIEVDGRIIAPLYSRLVVLDPQRGTLIREIELGDEIAAPLLPADDGQVWVAVGADQLLKVDPRVGKITFQSRQAYGAAWPPAVVAGRLVAFLKSGRGRTELATIDPQRPKAPRQYVSGLMPPLIGLSDFSGFVHLSRRPWSIVARNLSGKVRWQTRMGRPVRALSAPGDLVVSGVGRRVVVLDRKRGTRLWHSDFEAPVLDVHFEQEGGLVALDNGALYGLPGAGDPRLAAYLEQARLDLAGCQLDLRQYSAAQATAGRVLARDPAQLDAQALLARIASKQRSPEATAQWLQVLQQAPAADPVQADARTALEQLSGVQGLRTPQRALSKIDLLDRGQAYGQSATGPARVSLQTGAVQDAARPSPAVRLEGGPEPRLVNQLGAGLPSWSLSLAEGHVTQLAQGFGVAVLTGTTAQGETWLVQLKDGDRRWKSKLQTPILGAWPGPKTVLVNTEKGLFGLDAADGKQRFRRPTLGSTATVWAHSKGWLVVDGTQVNGMDTDGRRRFALRLGAGHRGLAIAAEAGLAYLWGEDGVQAIDLARGQKKGRLTGLKVQRILLDGKQGLLVLQDGRLVPFDATRAFSRIR